MRVEVGAFACARLFVQRLGSDTLFFAGGFVAEFALFLLFVAVGTGGASDSLAEIRCVLTLTPLLVPLLPSTTTLSNTNNRIFVALTRLPVLRIPRIAHLHSADSLLAAFLGLFEFLLLFF